MVRSLFTFVLLVGLLFTGCKNPTDPDGRFARPVFSPDGGTYTSPQTVSISTVTEGATIVYTTDGSNPDSESEVYGGPILINQATTIKARAIKTGLEDSSIRTAAYAFQFSPPEGFVEVPSISGVGVTISKFCIDKYEMTQAGFAAVMEKNPAYFQNVQNGPVERVSWFSAIEYCNRRSLQEGLAPCYTYGSYGSDPDNWPEFWNVSANNHSNIQCSSPDTGYRLPTEAEWEYAARGGSLSQDYIYSGSNDLNEVGWYWENWGEENLSTHSVGALQPNELGIFDMSGNVWEWCWDVFSGSSRVLRGGSWVHDADVCAVSFRCFNPANYGGHYIGFRVVRSL